MYKSFHSLFSPDSLANVEVQWAKEVKHFCKGVPVILVGNKIDLRGDQEMTASLAKKDQVRKKAILQSTRKINLKKYDIKYQIKALITLFVTGPSEYRKNKSYGK